MKRLLLTLCISASTIFGANAQDIEIKLDGTTTDISGTVHNVTTSSNAEVSLTFDVFNVSGSSLDLDVIRVNLNEPSGWSNYICWGHSTDPFGGLCYAASADSIFPSDNSPTIGMNEYGKLKVYVLPNSPSAVPALYRYYVGTSANPKMDSVDFQLNSTLSVQELKKDISISVSPNPATEKVNINVTNFEKGNLKIVDVLGNVVKNESFYGSKSYNVENFKNGVYFIIISGEGVNTINRKLVVRH